jgi:hypothetical protein
MHHAYRHCICNKKYRINESPTPVLAFSAQHRHTTHTGTRDLIVPVLHFTSSVQIPQRIHSSTTDWMPIAPRAGHSVIRKARNNDKGNGIGMSNDQGAACLGKQSTHKYYL